jgi:hypothetical protein
MWQRARKKVMTVTSSMITGTAGTAGVPGTGPDARNAPQLVADGGHRTAPGTRHAAN